jgi:hypothetical protein
MFLKTQSKATFAIVWLQNGHRVILKTPTFFFVVNAGAAHNNSQRFSYD